MKTKKNLNGEVTQRSNTNCSQIKITDVHASLASLFNRKGWLKKGFQKAVNPAHAKMTLMKRIKIDAVINKYSIGHVRHT